MLTAALAIGGFVILLAAAGVIGLVRHAMDSLRQPAQVIRMPAGETAAFNGDEAPHECEGQIVFPRDSIVACEGYWADDEAAAQSEGVPFPAARPLPFCGQQQWAKRLAFIEAKAIEAFRADRDFAVQVRSFRGLSSSRLTGELLGNKEFVDTVEEHPRAAKTAQRGAAVPLPDRRVCWTGDLRDHYVERHNVVPSRDFYWYVLERYADLTRV